MNSFENLCSQLLSWVWGPPLLLFLFGTGFYLTWALRGLQFRYLGFAVRQLWHKDTTPSSGDISPFASLMTSLAGAIGTGSIVGVATAISMGGLGSLFWMWVTTIFAMATKYAESVLTVKYREKDSRGEMIGGPMQYLRKGLGWKKTALFIAVLGIFVSLGTGNLVQTNSIAEALGNVWHIPPWFTGVFLAAVTLLVIVGGVRSIGNVAGILVPVMALFYLIGGIAILVLHYDQIPLALQTILSSAFHGRAAAGGIAGTSVLLAIQLGASHSIFSNEAGLGVSAISAAAARTDHPCRQGFVIMVGTVISTLVICSITGLVIAVTHAYEAVGSNGLPLSGATLAIEAFSQSLWAGEYIVSIGLVLFAFSTMIAWAYYGEKCCETLLGEKSIFAFRIFYSLVVLPAAIAKMEVVWHLADIMNGLITIPNLIGLLALTKVVVQETDDFLAKEDRPIPVTSA